MSATAVQHGGTEAIIAAARARVIQGGAQWTADDDLSARNAAVEVASYARATERQAAGVIDDEEAQRLLQSPNFSGRAGAAVLSYMLGDGLARPDSAGGFQLSRNAKLAIGRRRDQLDGVCSAFAAPFLSSPMNRSAAQGLVIRCWVSKLFGKGRE